MAEFFEPTGQGGRRQRFDRCGSELETLDQEQPHTESPAFQQLEFGEGETAFVDIANDKDFGHRLVANQVADPFQLAGRPIQQFLATRGKTRGDVQLRRVLRGRHR